MSLEIDANDTETGNKKILPRTRRVFYNGVELMGYDLKNNTHLSPVEMLRIFRTYEEYARSGNFDRIRDIEEENNYPKTWANSVIGFLLEKRHYLKTQRSI